MSDAAVNDAFAKLNRECPFCGAPPETLLLASHQDNPQAVEHWLVTCGFCFASGPVISDLEQAAVAWNKRKRGKRP